MKIRKLGEKRWKVVVFQGSPRDERNCPGMEPKTKRIMEKTLEKWSPFFEFGVVDLAIKHDKPSVLPCKGCISTAGGYHCHFPCSCYFKGGQEKDILAEYGIYEKLQECDAFIVFSPIHWHALSSQVKALFDRLVCTNQTLSADDAKNLMGDSRKDPAVTGKFARSGKHDGMLRNHLEGKTCAFYAHGDDGADDYEGKEMPASYDLMMDSFSIDPKSTVMPYVTQMKYSGVYVPDNLVQAFYINKGLDYSTANDRLEKEAFERADLLMENLLEWLDQRSSLPSSDATGSQE